MNDITNQMEEQIEELVNSGNKRDLALRILDTRHSNDILERKLVLKEKDKDEALEEAENRILGHLHMIDVASKKITKLQEQNLTLQLTTKRMRGFIIRTREVENSVLTGDFLETADSVD